MFWRKTTTITRPDRDRLVEITRAKANSLRWAMFSDDLRRAVSRAKVVPTARVPGDVVTMRSRVRLSDLTREREEVYTLVYPEEADLTQGKLSVLSPLGTALLGARVGDVVSLVTGTGPRTIKIRSVLYQPETAERVGPLPPNHGGRVMSRFPHHRCADASTPASRADYRDPVRSEEERQANAAQRAQNHAALRRAKLAERWVVYTIAAMLAVAMLPVAVAIAAVAAAVTVWRRVSLNLRRRANVTGTHERSAEAEPEQLAAVREVKAGIHVPRHRATIDVRQRKGAAAAGKPAHAWRRAMVQTRGTRSELRDAFAKAAAGAQVTWRSRRRGFRGVAPIVFCGASRIENGRSEYGGDHRRDEDRDLGSGIVGRVGERLSGDEQRHRETDATQCAGTDQLAPRVSLGLDRDAARNREPRGRHRADRFPEHQSQRDREHQTPVPTKHLRRPRDARVGQGKDREHHVARPRLDEGVCRLGSRAGRGWRPARAVRARRGRVAWLRLRGGLPSG